LISVTETGNGYEIENQFIQARVEREGYVSGVSKQSFLDKRTGARELGSGLDIADFLVEPLWDETEDPDVQPIVYSRDLDKHGDIPKRLVEGPQICTRAKHLDIEVIEGDGFVALKQGFTWTIASYGRKAGSRWEQTLLFLEGKRYFLSSDRITSANAVDRLIFRQDLPGHLTHRQGDTFQQIYLSYEGYLPCEEFFEAFPPDGRFLYQRDPENIPERMIRAYQVRLESGPGPWLAGMTLNPASVSEAWCNPRAGVGEHEGRRHVTFIQEIGDLPVEPGDSFGAAYVIGYFDSVEDMHPVYDRYKGKTGLKVTPDGWKLV